MITKEQLQLCEILLQKRQHKLIHKNKNFGLENSEKDSVGELSSYDNHPAEMATELYEREKDVTLHARREKELEQINAALHAIEEGTYGVCSVCGKAISFERLLLVPLTEYCSEHAEQGDDTSKQSASDDVINHIFSRFLLCSRFLLTENSFFTSWHFNIFHLSSCLSFNFNWNFFTEN